MKEFLICSLIYILRMESNGIKTENAKDKRPIRLLSPCFGGNKLYYNWDDNNALAIGTEIRDAIRLVQ